MDRLKFILIAMFAATACTEAELSWSNLTKENFTAAHNWAIVKAHIRDDALLKALMAKQKDWKKDISMDETIFTLYTRNGPSNGLRIYPDDLTSLGNSQFNKKLPVVVATHGFLSGGDVDWMIQMKDAQLADLNCNFITIDWSECAGNILYPIAKDCTVTVGGYLSELLKFLIHQGADVSSMHLMGHSLGAHLVSQVAQSGLRVSRITGWDPAGPLFDIDDLEGRLDPSDADFVDVIHTNCFLFGFDEVIGTADFFPNGGDNQPGCMLLDDLCDHSSSYYYYIESLYNHQKYPAMKCHDLDSAKDGECSGSKSLMGVSSVEGAPGIYYLKVDEEPTGSPPAAAKQI